MNKPRDIIWEQELQPMQTGLANAVHVVVHAITRYVVAGSVLDDVKFSCIGTDPYGNKWLSELSPDVEDRVRDYVLRDLLKQRWEDAQ